MDFPKLDRLTLFKLDDYWEYNLSSLFRCTLTNWWWFVFNVGVSKLFMLSL